MILFFVFQVSRSQFQDYCISHLDSLQSSPDQMREANQDQNHHDSLEDDSEFCDKKLLAINHLYNNSSEAILSVRGTVRGIRNRVRAGIKTFAPEKVTLAAIMVITVKPKWTLLLDHYSVASRSRKSYHQGPKQMDFLLSLSILISKSENILIGSFLCCLERGLPSRIS